MNGFLNWTGGDWTGGDWTGDRLFTSQEALLLAVFAAVVFLVLAVVAAVPTAQPIGRRLSPTKGKEGASLSYGDRSARSMMRRLERSFVPQDGRKRSAVRRRMLQAGYYGPHAIAVYYTIRVVLALALPAATLFVMPLVVGLRPIQEMYLAAVIAAAGGFYGPALIVSQRIAGRQRTVRENFPDALDLLLVCVQAGLSVNAALARVAGEIERACPLLSEHFQFVALEMQAGSSRESALRNLSERVGIEEVSALVSLLVQSDSMGVSIGQTLRVYADEMRRKRLLRAEEHANKLPVRMVLPLAGFVMPAFIIVIISPAIIRIVRIMLPAMGG